MVSAEHADAGAKLGAAERHHVLPDMGCNDLAMLRGRMGQYVLDEVIAVLVAGDVDQGNSGAVNAAFTDAVQISAKEVGAANLQALLDNFGGELIHAVLRSIANDVVDRPAAVRWSTVLTDVLDTPISKLAMGDDVDIGQDLLNAGALQVHVLAVIDEATKGGRYLVLLQTILKYVLYN